MIPIARPLIGEEEKKAVLEVLESGMLAQGPRVREFEEAFARYCGCKYGIATSNGTTALEVALRGFGITRGEVLVPSFTFIATATSVVHAGARPVFVDVDKETFTMDPEDLKKKITPKTRAIIPVHLYGQCAPMDEILEIARENNLVVIEDACQAHGAEYKKKKAGSMGDAGVFSFYPTKNMTTGEGGMVVTSNSEAAERMRLYRNHGQASRYEHVSLGHNYRMTDIAAAIGLEQLKKLEDFIEARRKNANYYNEQLENLDGVRTPIEAPERRHTYNQYTLVVEERDMLASALENKGIGYGIYYPKGCHEQPVFSTRDRLPNTDWLTKRVVSIPVYPGLSQEELETVARTIKSVFS